MMNMYNDVMIELTSRETTNHKIYLNAYNIEAIVPQRYLIEGYTYSVSRVYFGSRVYLKHHSIAVRESSKEVMKKMVDKIQEYETEFCES